MILKFHGTKLYQTGLRKKGEKWEEKLPTKVNISQWVKFAWNICSSISSHTTAIWNKARIN